MNLIDIAFQKQKRMLLASGKADLNILSVAERHALVIEYIGFVMEELAELRMTVPRRFWRQEKSPFEDTRKLAEFQSELADVWITLAALSAVSGVVSDDSDMYDLIQAKFIHNATRKDHTVS